MGWIRHHAIVVTGTYDHDKYILVAHAEAKRLFGGTRCAVSPVTLAAQNGTRSFFVAPDGSKEGWEESDDADLARKELTDWLDGQRYGDHSSPLAWVEIQYGDDACETCVCRDSDERRRAARR